MPDGRITLTLKIDPRLMKRIDERAAAEGENRTQYVLPWLPAYWEWQESDAAADTTRRIDESEREFATWATERLQARGPNSPNP